MWKTFLMVVKSMNIEKLDVSKILIKYPIMKVVGEAKVEKILEDSPDNIWEETKKYSGIDLKFYQKYFKDRSKAIAYKLTNIKKYSDPKELSSYGIKSAPQSFVYV